MVNILRGIGKSEHERVAEMLSAYIDGELTPAQKARVEAHLAECEECAQNLHTLRQTVSLLGQLPTVRAPRSFVIREAQVAPRRRAGLRWTRAYPALQGATVLAFLLFVVIFAGDVALTHFAPAIGGAPLAAYRSPVTEVPAAQWAAQEQAAEGTKETVVAEKVAPVEMTATPAETPVPPVLPAPTVTPVPAAADNTAPTPTLVTREVMEDTAQPTEETRMALAEKTAEATPSPPPTMEATPLPTATPVEVAKAPPPEREGGLSEESPVTGGPPPVSPARVALWVIEGGLLILAIALLAATLWMRRRRRRNWD